MTADIEVNLKGNHKVETETVIVNVVQKRGAAFDFL